MATSTFPFASPAQMNDTTPLSKRRRFVPSSIPQFMPTSENSTIENQTFDSPLLYQLCDQAPSQQEIEAQLLQVGMRIRKSVADGYQNSQHKFTPRPFFNMHRLSPATQAALCASMANNSNAGGLHNVGSMAMQPVSTVTFCGVNLAALSHISPAPIEEQKMWSYSTSHKRGYEGDSDSSDDQEYLPQTPMLGPDAAMSIPVDYFNIDFENISDVSPFTQVAEPFQPLINGRKMARPRARKVAPPVSASINAFNPFTQMAMPQQQPQQSAGTHWRGHKRMTSCGVEASMMMNVNDFGEANFLQRRDDVDMDCS